MAVAERQPIAIKRKSRSGEIARHVLLSAALGVSGATISHVGTRNLPGIEQKISADNDILDTLQVAGYATSGESSERIGSRTFPNGYRNPNMELVAGNLKVADLMVNIKGGSEQIEEDLGRAIVVAPQVGTKPGDTAGIQGIITRSARQFDAEVGALNHRKKLNLVAKFGGGLAAAAYPAVVVGSWILGKRRDDEALVDSIELDGDLVAEQTEKPNPRVTSRLWNRLTDVKDTPKIVASSEVSEVGEVDERKPFWIADKMQRDGTLLPKSGNQ